MAGLFNRTWSLRVGAPGEEGLEWGPPTRISFDVALSTRSSANKTTIALYNISPASIGVLNTEKAVINLRAGFDALDGQIFSGSVAVGGVVTERKGATLVTTITGGEGELELQLTYVVKSYTRGITNITIFKELADDLGVSIRDENLIETLTYSGGWVHEGQAKGALDSLAEDIGARWSIQAGQLLVLRDDQNTAETAYVISPESGMVGIPKQVKGGIEIQSLLLAPLRPGNLIIVQSESVNGTYRLDEVQHKGDYRGQDWYTNLKGRALKSGR